MNLSLHLSTFNADNHLSKKRVIRFAVVDLDRSMDYPENFVCMLPKYINKSSRHFPFVQLFGDNSLKIAKTLLTKALLEANDFEVISEIKRRLLEIA